MPYSAAILAANQDLNKCPQANKVVLQYNAGQNKRQQSTGYSSGTSMPVSNRTWKIPMQILSIQLSEHSGWLPCEVAH